MLAELGSANRTNWMKLAPELQQHALRFLAGPTEGYYTRDIEAYLAPVLTELFTVQGTGVLRTGEIARRERVLKEGEKGKIAYLRCKWWRRGVRCYKGHDCDFWHVGATSQSNEEFRAA
jgi:hypothetical protein